MPLRCPTSVMCIELKTTKQNIVKAREGLVRRGFISVNPGKSRDAAPEYTIINLPNELSDELSHQLSVPLSHQLSDELTIYKIKDKESNLNKNACAEKLSLQDLKQRLCADNDWIESVKTLLSNRVQVSMEDVSAKLNEFFEYLRCHGFEERDEIECKGHFINWLKKQFKYNSYGICKQQSDKRRSSDVTAKSAKDYEGAF